MVENLHIDFVDNAPPSQNSKVDYQKFNAVESDIIDCEIQKLIQYGVIVHSSFEVGQYVSPIFLRQKKNGEYRLILNLKNFNAFIPYQHFKMETFESALTLITEGMFFCSVDIRHAYYSVPIAKEHQKYLKFYWKGRMFQFTCLPNGLACGPRKFTKLMKPAYAKLRQSGHICTGFIDDSLLGGQSQNECLTTYHATTGLLQSLGFLINSEKSISIPTQVITYLGNNIDSIRMIVYLTEEKVQKICKECRALHSVNQASIRTVARVIGLLVSTFAAVEYGKLYYRELEMAKSCALKRTCGNFEASMTVTHCMKIELEWWVLNVHNQVRHLNRGNPQISIQTDSSTHGWGFVFEQNKIGGRWTKDEQKYHINVLELLAIWFAIKSLAQHLAGKHFRVLTDSTTAVCYISNMGGVRSRLCNKVAKKIWIWCQKNGAWISCSHIPGKDNGADEPSRQFNDKIEWELSDNVFQQLCTKWNEPEIDLFASRLNNKVQTFCSWKPDPYASYVDAFSLDWNNFNLMYLFPPFSLIPRCVQKIKNDRAQGIFIAPFWESQIWFSPLMKLLVDNPVILPKTNTLLRLPGTNQVHPLARKMTMIACRVSGQPSQIEGFLQKQPTSSCHPGAIQPKKDTKRTLEGGYNIVVNDKLIVFHQL